MESDGCCPCGHTGIFRCSSAPCQRIGRNGKSAVQNETVSGTENGTETKRAAVYVNLKTGDDTADGTTAETAVKTVEKAQELLAVAAAELQADGKTTEKNTAADTSKTAAEEAAEKYLVFVGMDEKELETYRKKQQKTDFRGRVTDTVLRQMKSW